MSPTPDLLAEDAANRERALAPQSFIVEAPAGAGKTELLVQRMLALLARVEEPEAIVALTFTRKAAAQMRERIEASLARAQHDEAPHEAHKLRTWQLARAVLARSAQRGWHLAQDSTRLRLLTLDALCASLARQMPLLSRFGAQPAPVEDASAHYREAARRALEMLEADDGGAFSDSIATVLGYVDNQAERLLGLLAAMLARREQWQELMALEHPEQAINAALRDLIDEELRSSVHLLDARWQERLMPLARFAASQLPGTRIGSLENWTQVLRGECSELPRWRAIAALMLTAGGDVRRRLDKRCGFPADAQYKPHKQAMQDLLDATGSAELNALRRLLELPTPPDAVAEVGAAPGSTAAATPADTDAASPAVVVPALVRLLRLCAGQLWLVFRERGEVDFVEMGLRAIAALGDDLAPSDLGLRLDYRIEHLLVDEFQDTSPTQVDLLARLTAGWQADDGRTLFLVGDPMQSIYRFRKADVSLFLNCAQGGLGSVALTPLRLSRNNRSTPQVVAWINRHFPAIFPPEDNPRRGEIRYREFVATRADTPASGVFCHTVAVADGRDAAAAAQAEAEAVLAIIAAERSSDAQRRIAVIARTRAHLAPIAAALRQRQQGRAATDADGAWDFSAVELEPLAERQIVHDLLALTYALHHRADRLNWLAILRAPWCGLRLADLWLLAGDDQRSTIWTLMNDETRVARLSADGAARLRHVRGVMGAALACAGRWPAQAWVERCWRALGGPACCGQTRDVADATAFFAQLAHLAGPDGQLDTTRLAERQALGYATPPAAGEGAARLQLMTIHKAKGLEFDTVIVPGLHRRSKQDEAPLLVWESVALGGGTHEQLLVAPWQRSAHRAPDDGTGLYDFLRRIETVRGDNEALRVLYVAATRARDSLHWVALVEPERATTGSAPAVGAPEDAAMAPTHAETVSAATATQPMSAATSLPGATPAVGLAGLHAPPGGTALAALWNAFAVASQHHGPHPADGNDGAAQRTRGGVFVPQLQRAARLPASADGPLSLPELAATQPFGALPVDEQGSLAADIGTLVHACLEQIVRAPAQWSAARVRGMEAPLAAWLGRLGWAGAPAVQGAREAIQMLALTVDSEDGRWVLGQHRDGAAELALARGGGNADIEVQVLDRCFVADGVRWIVDYKTTRFAQPPERAALRTHAERYRTQLARYAALFADGGLPVRCAIFYVACGMLVCL